MGHVIMYMFTITQVMTVSTYGTIVSQKSHVVSQADIEQGKAPLAVLTHTGCTVPCVWAVVSSKCAGGRLVL